MVVIGVSLRDKARLTCKEMAFVVSNPCFGVGRDQKDKSRYLLL